MLTRENYYFTSESVTEGHPDKVADQISDAVVDAVLSEDPRGRVACETMVTTGLAFIAGEISTACYVDFPAVARDTIRSVGYDSPTYGFDYETCAVITSIDEQSPDIAQGVDTGGAGDQGLMFGYATDESEEYMPMPILLAHKLVMRLAEARKSGEIAFLGPDGKSQVTVQYEDSRPVRVHNVVIAAQHHADADIGQLKEAVIESVIKRTIPADLLNGESQFFVNQTGVFVRGGPWADCGLTGRKNIVDTYGGIGSHGGGSYSGKDPTKVDRTGSYMARYIAKNLVAAGVAKQMEVQLAYCIGQREPVSVETFTYGTEKIPHEQIRAVIRDNFDMTPQGMIDHLTLRRPIYKKTACYGHFGRNEPEFTWERLDMVEQIQQKANL